MTSTLILGGTAWLGRTVARQAIAAGHDVTAFARGSAPTANGVTLVAGDRSDPASYAALGERTWDLVVDVAREPRQVRTAVDALGESAARWVFVSTVSVYDSDAAGTTPDESSPLVAPVDDPTDPEHYGGGKVACEAIVAELGERAVIARAGLIGGYGDESDRFGYWPAAFARAAGGPVLVPDIGARPVQAIDVDGLAAWLLHAGLDDSANGAYDICGEPVTFDELLATVAAVSGFTGEVVTADEAWLEAQGVAYWMGPRSLPLWLPAGYDATHTRHSTRARAAGLRWSGYHRLVAEALRDERERGLDRERRSGLTRAEERALLDASR